jgi:hypothetical protein
MCVSVSVLVQVRFDFFCKAALEFLLKTGRQPDILHCHDWSTAHVAKSFWEDYQPFGLHKPKVIMISDIKGSKFDEALGVNVALSMLHATDSSGSQ